MSRIVRVEAVRQTIRGAGPRSRRALTPVWPVEKVPTNVRPKTDPWVKQRPEGWDMFSRDGLWHYERYETGVRTCWRVTFLPTGQHVEDYSNKNDARAATAAGLQDRMATAAFGQALRTPLDAAERVIGHRWLAIHLRVAGKVAGSEADHRCACGGFLGTVTSDGALAHLDACDDCYSYGGGLPTRVCPNADRHRFCGDPLVAGVYPGCGLNREMCCPGNCRPE